MADYRETFIVTPGEPLDLAVRDPGQTLGFDKDHAKKPFKKNIEALQDLQRVLYAQARHAVLVVFQALDAGGKDGCVRHVFGPLNPASCRVTSFKAPTPEELSHDFLWRIHRAMPARGEIGVFNRSHYEDVLIVRVHELVPRRVWMKRYEQINAFEAMLTASDVTIVKFFLHISRDEQLRRLQKRLDDPTKHWKFNPQDFEERKCWDAYQSAYHDALTQCSTPAAPWYVIPSDHKWFRNLAVSTILRQTLEGLGMEYPQPDFDPKKIKLK